MIVGAGLTGLIAAHAFPQQLVLERAPGPRQMHKALLRFRTASVSDLTGIEFRAVTVRKGIWHDGEFRLPSIARANLYSRKVLGSTLARSIWQLEPVQRFIAPEDFYDRMVEAIGSRIHWGASVDLSSRSSEPMIYTGPMQRSAQLTDHRPEFRFAPITVQRYRVDGCDVHQTVYFPSAEHSLYRASITGSLLLCEFAGEPKGAWVADMRDAFALHGVSLVPIDSQMQQYGKIAPIDEAQRKDIIVSLTERHGIYSLGRFATWRNILLDDVVHDCAVIKRLMNADAYQGRLLRSGK